MHRLVNAFLLGFALDAALSLADAVLRGCARSDALELPRVLVASSVFLLALGLLPLLALTPRLPLGLLLPRVAFVVWTALGAAPAPLLLGSGPALDAALGLIQACLAVTGFRQLRRPRGATGWLASADALPGPGFRISRTLGLLAASAVALPLLLTVYLVLWTASSIETLTQGFVHFALDGIDVSSRRYVRDDRVVELVGMVHIGEPDGYREIFGSLGTPSTAVLEEGVTDFEAVVGVELPYEALSSRLGLEMQPSPAELWADDEQMGEHGPRPDVWNADVDASAFSPTTIAFLRELLTVYASGSLDEALRRSRHLAEREDADALWAAAEEDLIHKRNRHLLGEISAALEAYRRIVVPWGAYHLPVVEDALMAAGFELADEQRRPLIRYATLLHAALLPAGPRDPTGGESPRANPNARGGGQPQVDSRSGDLY